METQSTNKVKLGIFVMSALALFMLALYYIGSKKNIFHSTINVSATFNNVGGLLPGNNVRFNGINVGTVSKVSAVADTAIRVEFTVDENVAKYITINSIVSIGTDGMLGNKLVNIEAGNGNERLIEEGAVLHSLRSLEMDDALRTLNRSNSNLEYITSDLKNITQKISNSNSLWNLLSDSVVAQNMKSSVVNIKLATDRTAMITGDLKSMMEGAKSGKGMLGALVTDTLLSGKLKQIIVKLDRISDTTATISGDISQIVRGVKNGQGSFGVLLKDTSFVHNLNSSVNNINKGSVTLNEDLEALRYSWPFKKYFKRKEK